DHEHHHDHEEHDHEHHHDHEEHDHEHHHHHHDHEGHHHADEVFTSWGKETPKKFTEEGIRSILEKLADEDSQEYGIILRAKGIVPDVNGKWLHFDLVPGEEEVRYGSAEYTGRICVIGSELKEDKLSELFGL
ncbi:MAG: cobalamin biosynthesis protein CobW, partial [Clostridiales bacterium]|nr:cobalamin biosynthesis protein CobW [Clostridiales bacterium]